jgi:hypothetical protein
VDLGRTLLMEYLGKHSGGTEEFFQNSFNLLGLNSPQLAALK